jgi:beta-lactamase regulating signal transducer with metallopeptidase domain
MSTLTSLSSVLVYTAIKATMLLALGAAAGLLLRKRSASTRHMVRTVVLGALLLLPFSGILVPAWRLTFIPEIMPASTQAGKHPIPARASAAHRELVSAKIVASASSPTVAPRTSSPAISRDGLALTGAAAKTYFPANNTESREKQFQIVGKSSGASTPAPAAAGSASSPAKLRLYWPQALFLAWLLGALLFAIHWIAGSLRAAAVVRRASPCHDQDWIVLVQTLARRIGIRRHVTLRVSHEVDVPFALGTLHPAIVLPPDYQEWSDLRRNAILNHELAHIHRFDTLAQYIAQCAAVAYWLHPLVWTNVRSMRVEREHACDDHVLATGTKASDYAHELLDIVSGMRQPELAGVLAMARRSQLEGRVLAVLNPGARRGSASPAAVLLVGLLALAIVIPLAAMRPSQKSARLDLSAALNQRMAPSAPNLPDAPDGADAPVAPELPDAPDGADAPVAPELPDAPDGADAPDFQFAPAVPSAPSSPAAPAAPSAPAAPTGFGSGDLNVCGTHASVHHMNMESSNGSFKKLSATWSGDDCNVDLRAEGEIAFTADAMQIQSISSGGFFEVNQRQGSTLRQIKVTPSAGGLQFVYKLNGKEQPFDAEAKSWFSAFLLALERSTGLSADTRVPKLFAQGGPTAVLDEVNNLQGDYVRARYLLKLLEQPKLAQPVVIRIINQSGQQISSDYELARVLMEVSKQYDLADEASRNAFLSSTGKLRSDYEHARVLIELLKRPNISKENVRVALDSSANIKSDYEKSRILLSLLEQKSFDQSYLDFYLKMVSTIQSDYEKSRDLLAPMQKYPLALNQTNQIMDAAAEIRSDYEKSRLLIALAQKGSFDEKQMANYLKVVDAIKSDYERSRALMELMQHNRLSTASVSKALEAVSRGNSDNEKSRVLTSLVTGQFDENQTASYLRAVDSMTSDFERARCLLALMESAKLSNATLAKALEAAGRIKSDYEKSRVLQTVARKYPLEGAIRETYIRIAESIGSEYERNRALAGMVHRATL